MLLETYKMKYLRELIIIILCLLLPIKLLAFEEITIGTITEKPKRKIKNFEYFSNYLSKKLAEENIKVNVRFPKSINESINLIQNNKLDIFIESVYPMMLVKEKSDIDIVCKRWKKGEEGYYSVIFVKKDGSINSIKDLKGKHIGFEDKFSTSGYYVAKKAIENNGLKLNNFTDSKSLQYSFTYDETNTISWLLFSKIDAGVMDKKTFEDMNQNQFKIVYQSEMIPRHLVSFSKNMKVSLQEKILEILYSMHETEEGKIVLKNFARTKKFTPLTSKDLAIIEGI